jgi:hypothetical protein
MIHLHAAANKYEAVIIPVLTAFQDAVSQSDIHRVDPCPEIGCFRRHAKGTLAVKKQDASRR